MNNTTCIRVLADPTLLNDCKTTIERLDSRLSIAAKIYNLTGNEIRLKILLLLQREGKLCPCDLSDILGITVGGISQHLRKLKDGGMVKDKKVGQTVYYSIIEENNSLVLPTIKNLLKEDIKDASF